MLLNIFVFTLGTVIGSFINVCICRLPRNESVVRPRSYCPACRKSLTFIELIPIVSYLLLRGRCSACKAEISSRYPLVELLSGLLLWSTLQRFGLTYEFYLFGLLNLTLLLIIYIDLDHYLILNVVTVPVMFIGLLASVVPHYPFDHMVLKSMLYAISGLLAGGGILYLIAALGHLLFKKEAMGMGDVKMMAMLGAFLGPEYVLYILFLAALLGAGYGVVGILIRKLSRKDMIPFGPFIALAAYIMIFYGAMICSSYIELIEW